jgi:acyl transferase domain-containing protein
MSELPDRFASLSPLKRALLAIDELQAKLADARQAAHEPIAVIGIGCRMPGKSDSPEAMWRVLREGVSTARQIPADRFDIERYYDPNPDAPGKIVTKWGAFIDDVDRFDAPLFGIAPREAMSLDPQQRLLLEVIWQALEHGGQAPDRLSGSRTSVFVGIVTGDYAHLLQQAGVPDVDGHYGTGIGHSLASGRVSYILGLQGPALSIDTACSSSLVGVHLACQSLRAGDCRMAIAAGVNVMLTPELWIVYSRSHMLSADDRCKTFDATADGFLRGEGAGAVVLKRLSDAVADGDRVLAVIRGSAINQDGPSSSLTAPNGPAQEAVIRAAVADAGIDPLDVTYVEAHGTGTPLGDPIEIQALAAALGQGRDALAPLLVGSAKTNFGHLEGAAGVAGLIKLVLALQHGEIPPHLHLTRLNPHVDWESLPLDVPTTLTPWPAGRPRIGGVSSFGFSGTNVHVILEAAAEQAAPAPAADRPLHLLTVSARTESALERRLHDLSGRLEKTAEAELADVCHTANVGRAHHAQRVAVVAGSADEMRQQLAAVASGQKANGTRRGTVRAMDRPRLAFLFTGQGAQYAGMGRNLYDTQPTYRHALDRCADAMRPHLPADLRDVLFDPAGPIEQTMWTQPALFAVEYALAALWQSWGVKPAAVLGHSIGEFTAACVAGAVSVEDAARLIAVRGGLMQRVPPGGAMAAVFADAARVSAAIAGLEDRVALAAVNAPDNVVISGTGDAIDGVLERLRADGVRAKRLVVSHAFHSPLLEPILDEFEREASALSYRTPAIPVISNVTGGAATGGTYSAAYWRRHARETVRFADGIRSLHDSGIRVFIECGPNPTLVGLGQRCFDSPSIRWLSSLRQGHDDWRTIAGSLAELYTCGADIDWAGFDRDYARRKVSLPAYPFDRERHWVSPPAGRARTPATVVKGHPLLGQRVQSPALSATVTEARVGRETHPFLYDHSVLDTPIMPATGFLEIALAAATRVFANAPHHVADVVIQEAMVLPAEGELVVQSIVKPESPDAATLEIVSAPDGAGELTWTCHATARLERGGAPAEAVDDSLGQARERCQTPLSRETLYGSLRERGIQFGPAFINLTEVWCGDRETVARAELSAASGGVRPDYVVHPALLDTALQTVGAAAFAAEGGAGHNVYLPLGIERCRVERAPGSAMWLHAQLRDTAAESGTLLASVRLFDSDGVPIGELSGLRLRRADRAALLRLRPEQVESWFYAPQWEPAELPVVSDADAAGTPHRWLVLGDRGGIGRALARDLADRDDSCVLAASGVRADNAGEIAVDPEDPASYDWLVNEASAAKAIVYCWGLDVPAAGVESGDAARRACTSLLLLIQALSRCRAAHSPRLVIVTRGGQPVEGPSRALAPGQAALWGFGNAIALEHPELRCVRLDLDPHDRDEAAVASLLREVLAETDEDRVGYRSGRRLVARLARTTAELAVCSKPYRLEVTERGALERLQLRPFERPQPGRNEVEIRVAATGLNFRDVLNALGMYPGDPGPLGGECAGTVVSVGPGVTTVKPGDAVIAVATGCFSSHVIADERLVVRRPGNLDPEQASAIPIAYITAYLALHQLASLRKGQRVLIHAAAGGVGFAAVHLALRAGAEVFATAGSDEKRALLRSLGVARVMNSRTPDFAGEVLRATGGRGVDVVLNSLSGELIRASFDALAEGGTFLEIGKNAVWTAEQVAALGKNITYHLIDWSTTARQEPAAIAPMFADLVRRVAAGELPLLPHRVFALAEAPSAFRLMSQGRHIGKIVLRHPAPFEPGAPLVRADGTYLVTGGLGGLGLVTADWLVGRGARDLVLVGRHEPAGDAAEAVEALRQKGASVTTAAIDVADGDAMGTLLERIRREHQPLRGVIHAAGVFADATILTQTSERFAEGLAPKVAGTLVLDALTRTDPLDFFVCYSSVASVFGAMGQPNYAAANAFEDAMAMSRTACGLPATSVSWGAWAEVGAAVRARVEERTDVQGLGAIRPQAGMQALEWALRSALPHLVVAPIDWSRFSITPPGAPDLPLLSGLARHQATAAQTAGGIVATLASAAPNRKRKLMLEHVRGEALRVLGLGAGKTLDDREPLQERGLDSLMAIELRNVLARSLDRALPATLIFDYPTVEALSSHLLSLVVPDEDQAAAQPASAANAAPDVVGSIEELSDEEVERLFAARVGQGN